MVELYFISLFLHLLSVYPCMTVFLKVTLNYPKEWFASKSTFCCCYILVTSVSISLKELLVAVATSLDMIAAISYWFI